MTKSLRRIVWWAIVVSLAAGAGALWAPLPLPAAEAGGADSARVRVQPQAEQGSKRPNILYIFTDQQHAGMLSCAGNKYLRTPAMDSLARSGMRFQRAYCSNPVCVPSRFTMMTGLMPSRIGMESNEDSPKVKVSDAILRQSLGCIFRSAGYKTAYGGKVHLPMSLRSIGFEPIARDERSGLADACVEFLRKKRDKPFLLVASFINPHDICYMAINDHAEKTGGRLLGGVERRYLAEALALPQEISRDEFFRTVCPPPPDNYGIPPLEPEGVTKILDLRPFRPWVRQHWTDPQWRLHRWAYCRLTERVDVEIGKVLQALRDTGLEDNTLVVFSSDHGDMDASHRMEHKSVLYEEATRVPLIISFKGSTKPGRVDDRHLVSNGLDLIPTLCDYAGIAPPEGLLGRSLKGLAEGREPDGWREYVAVETQYGRTLRSGRYKYNLYDSGKHREQLIDLEKDPGEMTNLAQTPECREILDNHRKMLRRWVEQNHDELAKRYLAP